MKNNYIIIALLLVVAHFNVNAQLSPTHTSKKKGLSINEFDLEEDPIWFINALEAENVCDCSENISFNYDSFITSAFLMERAMKAARKEWLSRQENLVNEEIEKAFNTDFPNYREARKRLLKHQESTIVDHTIVGVKDKYITKRNQKRNYQETLLKEIKLLNFREEELRRGVISSKYGHLKLGAIPIKDLNLNAVLNEKRNRLSAFTTNNIALKKEGNIANELAKINNLPSGELNHGIFELLYAKQNEYFSKYNDWEQLNLTYVYLLNFLHPTRGPEIPNSITVNGKVLYQQFFGRADFLEHLAINNYGGNVSADNVSTLLETISIDDMLADTAVKNLGQRNVDFLKSRPKLLSEIREYFKVNDFSKISHDCVNYLLNQLQDGNSFAPNTNLYLANGIKLFQNATNPNRALSFNLNDQAIKEGFTNFGNVLSELFADGENVGYEGYIIRNIFIKNGIYIPSSVIDTWLGFGFTFVKNNGQTIKINFEGNFGELIWNQGSSINTYFSDLEEYYNTYFCNCRCSSSETGFTNNLEDNMEPKWGQLANKQDIIDEINSIQNLSTLSFENQILALESHFNKNISYRRVNGVLTIANPNDDVSKYIYTKVAGWLDFHHIFKLFKWARNKGPVNAILSAEFAELYQQFNGNYSAFSYEDFPSNNVGVALFVRFGNELEQGSITWTDAINKALDEMMWVNPEDSPNFDYIPHIINGSYPKNFTYKPLLGESLKNYHRNEFCKRPYKEQNNIREAHEKFNR
ncbi:exported hypothetical protein [Tenacibaculum maritimum]|uniref:hypothetical protein n=1 Tax=Tenacibaculum maritimum TaxID=107401 RepID=UPI0012E5941B|nr:hypothetical protein [Tenacibaculum maritimum]CAA0239195.1 exported hypothetical protein [Tenacibaculum maritimum]